MPSSTGVNAATGRPQSDWDNVEQAVGTILTTPIGARVMRRDFGSELPDLIDQKMTRKGILSIYSAAATAVERWEPRFRIRTARVRSADQTGLLALDLYGTYYPLGHLGDYSVAEDMTTRIVLEKR